MVRRRQRTYRAVAEINIANLVDVVLVLLIVFMISAPLLQSGIDINLPKTRAPALGEETQGIVISIDSLGGIYVNDRWARLDQLEEAVDREIKAKGISSVFIRADSLVPYGVAIGVIGRLKEMGIPSVGLVTGHKEAPTP
ncbi:MAG: biopolymer transporter ExbD [candidate division Zixibacteria bacterium]|nr:biopolymer transporter ExbD [candidate division Zixibacteria bacterium]